MRVFELNLYSMHYSICMSNKLGWEPYSNMKKYPVFFRAAAKKLAFISSNFHTQNSGKLPTFRAISAGPLSDSFHTQNSGKVILSHFYLFCDFLIGNVTEHGTVISEKLWVK